MISIKQKIDLINDENVRGDSGAMRTPLKLHRPNWKVELRNNCLKRVRNERYNLLWKMRIYGTQAANGREATSSAVQDIIYDEIAKVKQSLKSSNGEDDLIWDYDGSDMTECGETDSEELLLEMQRLLYEDLKEESSRSELEALEEEDAYLARAVFEHMQLGDNEGAEMTKVWCPVCKRGELQENHYTIQCNNCDMRLNLTEDKVSLDRFRDRLAEVHLDHFDRGCKEPPKFCVRTMFGLTALYLQCQACDAFEVVV